MKTLVSIELYNGLANRLRTIWSAAAYQEHYNLRLRVVWPITPDLPTSHERLVRLNSGISIRSVGLSSRSMRARFKAEKLVLSTLGFGYERRESVPWVSTFTPKKPRVPFYWLRTCYEFFPTDRIPCPFQPSDEVNALIDSRRNRINIDLSSAIGIHIRRRDHTRAIKRSPLSLFIDRIHNLTSKDSDQQFFVCSDDNDEILRLQGVFGRNRIVSSEARGLPRNHPEAALDAMADLVLLSKCKAIWGSYGSSFSSVAGRISGIPTEEIGLESINLPSEDF